MQIEIRARDLTPAQILAACQTWTPANASIEAAITAHELATATSASVEQTRRAFRSVILAIAERPDVRRRQLDYLSALPIEAWQTMSGAQNAAETRRSTLAAISWAIARQADN